ncbi:prolyl oligopeptidase family serine peptidase [Aquimarina spongiae]|uniref:prolyl oligopeptidase n=1 Tax=Aquimarina spongiae TaxID=570521 RepID=A0A1M6JLH6_9FLAO|nr:prolyl oligopeptidase family serine peptidase [Aquimarina spongiae]SHJ47559.1 prolyl oligopeptidase [Aquimarina spongiae]
MQISKVHKGFLFLLTLLSFGCQKVQKEVVHDSYFGQVIQDPFRNLEYLENKDVLQWIHKENSVTTSYLNTIPKQQDLIDQQIAHDQKNKYFISRLNYTPNGMVFFLKQTANENRAKLYYKKNTDSSEVELFNPKDFDPQSKDEYQISYIKPSWDGSKIVVSLIKNGDENATMFVLDVKTKKKLSGSLTNGIPSGGVGGVQWLADNTTLYYTYFPNINNKSSSTYLNGKAILYKTGTDFSQIKDVFSTKNNPDLGLKSEDFPTLSINNSNFKYVIGIVSGATQFQDAFYLPTKQLFEKEQPWKPLYKKEHKVKTHDFIGENDIIYLTAQNAPNFKICKTSFTSKNFDHPEVLITEKKDEVIKYLTVTSKGIFYSTVKNGVIARLFRYHKGEEKEITLPKPSGDIKLAKNGQEIIISLKGWLSKTQRYTFDEETNSLVPYNIFPDNGHENNFADLTIEEVTVKGHDGVEIPLSLIYQRDLKKDGTNPILMRSYGAYGSSMIPTAYYPFLLYVREGGIYAVAHVRGGGEKGDAWRNGGYKTTKPNTWKDIISCTEYLITNNYTSKRKIAIWGGSAGAVGVGRALTERPDLYGAAILSRGILNTVRIEAGINGANSAKEFGTIKDSIEFRGLYNMDAYHHIKDNTSFPATLVTTGMNDSRVPPWQSFKFAARLQEANTSKNPILLKTEFDSGHGLQSTKKRGFETIATALSFALRHTGHPNYQPEE